ncbi:hypothetical protein ACFLU6_12100, partial [Acidobacteriota bacterium]
YRRTITEKTFTARYNEAAALANAGNIKRAVAIAEELVESAPNEEYRNGAGSLLEHLRRAFAEKTFTERYNEAAALAKAGDMAGAIAIVEKLAESAPSDERRAAASRFLKELRKYR